MLCPLCGKECEPAKDDPGGFKCSTLVNVPSLGYEPHFIRYRTGGWSTGAYYREEAILLPYKLSNNLNSNVTKYKNKGDTEWQDRPHFPASHIMLLQENHQFRQDPMETIPMKFKHILRTPLIHMDIEEKLRARLKLILLLS